MRILRNDVFHQTIEELGSVADVGVRVTIQLYMYVCKGDIPMNYN